MANPRKGPDEQGKTSSSKNMFDRWWDAGGMIAKAQKIAAMQRSVDLPKRSPEILTIPDNAWQIAIATQEIILGLNRSDMVYYLDQNLAVVAQFGFDFEKPKTGEKEALDKWHDAKRRQIKADYPHVIMDTYLELPFPQMALPPEGRVMNVYRKAKEHKQVVVDGFTAGLQTTELYKYLSPAMRREFIQNCVYGQVTTESGWDPKLNGRGGTRGVFQISPSTARGTVKRNASKMAGLKINPKRVDLYDPGTCSKIVALHYDRLFSRLQSRFDKIQVEFGYTDKESFDKNLVMPFLLAGYHGGGKKMIEMIDWFLAPKNLAAHKKVAAGFKSKSDLYFYISKQFYYRHEVPMGAQGKRGLFGRGSYKYPAVVIANRRLLEDEEESKALQVSYKAGENVLGFINRSAKQNKVDAEGIDLEGLALKVGKYLKVIGYDSFKSGDEIEIGSDYKGIYAKLVLWKMKDSEDRVSTHFVRFRPEIDEAIVIQLNRVPEVIVTPRPKVAQRPWVAPNPGGGRKPKVVAKPRVVRKPKVVVRAPKERLKIKSGRKYLRFPSGIKLRTTTNSDVLREWGDISKTPLEYLAAKYGNTAKRNIDSNVLRYIAKVYNNRVPVVIISHRDLDRKISKYYKVRELVRIDPKDRIAMMAARTWKKHTKYMVHDSRGRLVTDEEGGHFWGVARIDPNLTIVIDEIREGCGFALHVDEGVRPMRYGIDMYKALNDEIIYGSPHFPGRAVDFVKPSGANTKETLAKRKKFRQVVERVLNGRGGGLGKYRGNIYHVDVKIGGHTKRSKGSWDRRRDGKYCFRLRRWGKGR